MNELKSLNQILVPVPCPRCHSCNIIERPNRNGIHYRMVCNTCGLLGIWHTNRYIQMWNKGPHYVREDVIWDNSLFLIS